MDESTMQERGVLDIWHPDEGAVLEAAEKDVPAFTPEQARIFTEQLRVALVRLDHTIFALYVGMAWKSLGYSSWSEYCQKERLVTRFVRYAVPDRSKLHYELYHVRGMAGRAVGAVTGYDQKTVTADVERVLINMRQAGLTPPPRPVRIQATNGSMRTVSARAKMLSSAPDDLAVDEQVVVKAAVIDDDRPFDEQPLDEVTVEAEPQPQEPQQESQQESQQEPQQPAERRRRRDWPSEYRDVTTHMARIMDRLQRLADDRARTDKYLPDVPNGDRQNWADWAAIMVDWAARLDEASEE